MVRVPLRDGSAVTLRPAVPEDRALLLDGFARLSDTSRYRRFFSPLPSLSAAAVAHLTAVGSGDHFAWVALDDEGRGVGVARYVRSADDRGVAEPAVTVVDEFQGRGLGTALFEALAARAAEAGIGRFEGDVLAENGPMLALLGRAGARLHRAAGGVVRFDVALSRLVGAT